MNLRRILFSILIFTTLVACSRKDENLPENLIPREEFVDMMVDIQLFESMSKVKKDRKQNDFDVLQAYEWLFRKHNTDAITFKSSFDYYAGDPKVLEEIYDDVIIRLSEREATNIQRAE